MTSKPTKIAYTNYHITVKERFNAKKAQQEQNSRLKSILNFIAEP